MRPFHLNLKKMTITVNSFLKRGYVPIAVNKYAGIAWEGEYLKDFWMWNRQYIDCSDGARRIQTVKVATLKEAALRYWRDNWVPLTPVDEPFLERMEESLRNHRGLKAEGVRFPEGRFLKQHEPITLEPEDRDEGKKGRRKSGRAVI